jgi:serine/threonine protein kinase
MSDPQCQKCGTQQPLGNIGGMCPGCLARGGEMEWLVGSRVIASAVDPVVPGWRLLGTLGAGGMGRVFLAESEEGRGSAAIKVLDAKWARDPLMVARFENEASALRSLDHPSIVRLIETVEAVDGRLSIVMEFVDGCDLGRLLRAQPLPHARGIEIFEKVCAAVAHAHRVGFVHRDIKPSNILIGGDETVKLADFGFARQLTTPEGPALQGLTATTDQFGTAYYLAPERMMPGSVSDERADVFSLGVLLYHLLAGRMPLGKFTPLSEIAGLPAAVDGVVVAALEADPAQRTGSVEALREGFAKVWGEHISGRSRARQIRRATLIFAGIAFTVAAAIVGAVWQRERMKPPPPAVFVAPSLATTQQPWENSLGMKFVPVPETNVLFSIWETRRRDYEPFRAADFSSVSAWRVDHLESMRRGDERISTFDENGAVTREASWEHPGQPTTPEDPAGGMSIRNAQHFCLWLTWRERAEGRLPDGYFYRLPTNAEWLAAVGGEQAVPRRGNVAGLEARESPRWPQNRPTLDTRDPFMGVAPVGSFPVEPHGLYDLSGNVSEWVLDEAEPTNLRPRQSNSQLRGPNCVDGSAELVSFAYHRLPLRHLRIAAFGFRVVLAQEAEP